MDLVTKSPRYLTLMGDDIANKNFLSQVVGSNDAIFTSLATAFIALADTQNSVESATAVAKSNIEATVIHRLLTERIILRQFSPGSILIDKEKLKNLSIDTTPTAEACFESTRKHGPAIQHARRVYGVILSWGIALPALTVATGYATGITPESINTIITSIVKSTTHYNRMYSGYSRFNKIAKGEWAITTTPKGQEYKQTSILPEAENTVPNPV